MDALYFFPGMFDLEGISCYTNRVYEFDLHDQRLLCMPVPTVSAVTNNFILQLLVLPLSVTVVLLSNNPSMHSFAPLMGYNWPVFITTLQVRCFILYYNRRIAEAFVKKFAFVF